MKALRIRLHQTSANYRREETVENKMTYPLPPISTIIGAFHGICGYTEYKEMGISVQGKFASMHKEPYLHYSFLNSTKDDRGILVKMKNENLLANAFIKVAKAQKSQGNSFLKGITIQVYNEELLEEYQNLRKLGDKISEWKKGKEHTEKLLEYKRQKTILASEKKRIGKGKPGFTEIVEKEKKVREEEKSYKEKVKKYEEENYKKPISKYRTLTTSLRYYEILDDIDLIIHVCAEEEVLNDIYNNIYSLKSLGRSEDFVDIQAVEIVELIQGEEEIESPYSAYLKYEDVKNEKIFTGIISGRDFSGTKYYLGKKYEIINGKRLFNQKVKVVYTADFSIEKTSENVWIDVCNNSQTEMKYIVNFL